DVRGIALECEPYRHWPRLVAPECQLTTNVLTTESGQEDRRYRLDVERPMHRSGEEERHRPHARIVRLHDCDSPHASLHTISDPFEHDRSIIARGHCPGQPGSHSCHGKPHTHKLKRRITAIVKSEASRH